jgi:serine/threonine-protein kinase
MIGSAQLVGAQLGNYEIQSLLGAGGMASVYRGFDRNLRRPVAIKVLPDLTTEPDFATRFRQEARLIAGLRHPNIVQVYDFGEQAGLIYMVQELLAGPTLQQWMHDLAARGSRTTRDEVLTIVGQLAGALDAAHAAGIIHRDVKPANAIWNAGALVLTDFGIAKSIGLPNLTQTGLVIGTPDYLSPEQAKGLPLTPSSDIYSLGVVLYELLAGRLPFIRGTALGVAMAHIQDAPPPFRSLRPDLPAAVEGLVQQALAKDPSARFRTAGALAQGLSQAWPATHSAAVLPADLHEQPTRIWEARPAGPLATPATGSAPIAISEDTSQTTPATTRSYGRAIGLLLAVAVIGGLLLFGRALSESAAIAPTVPAAEMMPIASQPTGEPVAQATAASAPTAIPAPTEVPATAAPAPTAIPAPTEVPATIPHAPTAISVPSSAPLDQLRELLEAGKADGRAGSAAGAMLSDLSKVKQALDDRNEHRAADRLGDLQKRLLDGIKSKKVDSDFAHQALAAVNTIASTYGLALPPLRDQGDKDKDK